MNSKKETVISLRRDMGHVLWSGLQLHAEADIRFRIERIRNADGLRVIRGSLVRPGFNINLDVRQEFDISVLGTDYAHLESLEAEMMVVSRYVTHIHASVRENGIELVMQLPEQPQVFWLAAGIEGRWDWFVDPREMSNAAALLASARPVGQLRQQAAA